MEKLLAEVTAELVAEAKPGWDHLTLRASCDSMVDSQTLELSGGRLRIESLPQVDHLTLNMEQ